LARRPDNTERCQRIYRAQGFKPSQEYPGRFEKDVDEVTLFIDFLVEFGGQASGTRMGDDVPASVTPGVVRALETARRISIEGTDLFGARHQATARVCGERLFERRFVVNKCELAQLPLRGR
jgi:hypothetical protein